MFKTGLAFYSADSMLYGRFETPVFKVAGMRFASRYIAAPHPKAEVRPDRQSVERILARGWVGQLKIHGHRAQIHLNADEDQPVLVYTRQGVPHKLEMQPEIVSELRRIFNPQSGWTALDAEWLKPEKQLYVFDVLKKDGVELDDRTYPERHSLLPRIFISPHVAVLPLLKTADKCMEALSNPAPHIEGLVFKSLSTTGFADTSILRCRKR